MAARLTREEGRRFGLTLGGALFAFAALAWWREHGIAAALLMLAGAGLSCAGLAVPTQLGPLERSWMRLAHAMSSITTPVVMAVMYLGVFLPVGVLRRLFGGNPLVHPERQGSFWRHRPHGFRRTRDMRRQF